MLDALAMSNYIEELLHLAHYGDLDYHLAVALLPKVRTDSVAMNLNFLMNITCILLKNIFQIFPVLILGSLYCI